MSVINVNMQNFQTHCAGLNIRSTENKFEVASFWLIACRVCAIIYKISRIVSVTNNVLSKENYHAGQVQKTLENLN